MKFSSQVLACPRLKIVKGKPYSLIITGALDVKKGKVVVSSNVFCKEKATGYPCVLNLAEVSLDWKARPLARSLGVKELDTRSKALIGKEFKGYLQPGRTMALVLRVV